MMIRGRSFAICSALVCSTVMLAVSQIVKADDSDSVTDVWVSGQDGYHTYRIPALITTKEGTVLAFCEGRKDGRGDSGDIDLLMKRSSDGGKTWSSNVVLWDDGKNTCGNPCPVVDQRTGHIHLLLTWNQGTDGGRDLHAGTANGTRRVFYARSENDGRRWTDPVEITDDTKEESWWWYATGPGVGIQLTKGQHKGRLVIPCDHTAPDYMFGSHVIYSDDAGKSWSRSEAIKPTCNESQVVELSDGRLMINMRSQDKDGAGRPRNGYRSIAFSEDGGATWTEPHFDDELGDPVCQASIIRYDDNHLIFSNPNPTVSPKRGKRVRMTIRVSTDDGKTWSDGRLVDEEASAYSCLTRLPDGDVGCLYESDGKIELAKLPIGNLLAESGNRKSPATNVVFFLIDDLGWRDLGCFGSTYYQTPNIDQLAAEGMRFTNGYAACNVCSPTRAAIMTGKYPARLLLTQWLPSGRWNNAKNKHREARYLSNLPLEEFTIAEALREAGYATAFMGKWHLGTETYYYPEHQGFDVNVAGRDYGAPGSYFYPFEGSWKIPTTGLRLRKESPLSGKYGDYLVDRLAEEAESFIRENADEPFFLMLSHYAVHSPLQGKPDKVARYDNVADANRQGHPHYAAMVESVDDSVGRVMETIRDLELEDRTIFIFTSDNGGFAKATDNSPLRANKGSNYEGGIRVPVVVKWPGKTIPGSTSDEPVISTDFYPTILDATGLPSRPYQHVDGVSLVPILSGRGGIDRDALYWHYPHYNQHPSSFPSGVIRSGNWKLIESYETGEVSLFNLAEDVGEQNDLADRMPQRVADLRRKLAAWRDDVGADPMKPNPEYVAR